jgi:hypothetical protein
MLDRVYMQIDVEVGPVQVIGLEALHIQDGANGRFLEPGKPVKGQEQFATIEEEPEAVD